MKIILLLAAFVQITFALDEWEQFKATYQKVYKSEEEENLRKQVFLERLKLVKEQNERYEKGLSSFTTAINTFSDRTRNELYYTSPKTDHQQTIQSGNKRASYKSAPRLRDDVTVPDSIDWRDYGVITPIANQKSCKTCWAFAVVATIEAHMAIYRGVNVSLSQQNLADCVDPTFTCKTDMKQDIIERAYQYVIDNNGIETLETYPYEYQNVGTCRYNSENVGATIEGYANVTEYDEEELKRIVGTVGPVTVAIVTTYYFDIYQRGVLNDYFCEQQGDDFLNHAVVIVGYGTEDDVDYWLVKNSWGTWFGDEGYVKMARNQNNQCGIGKIARYPLM